MLLFLLSVLWALGVWQHAAQHIPSHVVHCLLYMVSLCQLSSSSTYRGCRLKLKSVASLLQLMFDRVMLQLLSRAVLLSAVASCYFAVQEPAFLLVCSGQRYFLQVCVTGQELGCAASHAAQ
jgi:hypothetical protein